ncbi:hypothetical protein HNY73_001239 [Argiope bruennichi]|uniref:Gustatory receptor n=1 Tax=Argiope bruennichi TaxID=94029 RepID=A0A8T0G4E0_ARGBR|nr:hypothetical protein HNY73_001239 [Argiope bruennichi]
MWTLHFIINRLAQVKIIIPLGFDKIPSIFAYIVEALAIHFYFVAGVSQSVFVTYYSFVCKNLEILLCNLHNQLQNKCSVKDFDKYLAVYEKIVENMSTFDEHFSLVAFLSTLLAMICSFSSGYSLAFSPDLSQTTIIYYIISLSFYLSTQLVLMITDSLANELLNEIQNVLQESLNKLYPSDSEKRRICINTEESNLTLWKIYVLDRSLAMSSIGTLVTYGILLATLGK